MRSRSLGRELIPGARSLRRALVGGLAGALIAVAPVFADTVVPDGDLVTPGNQNVVDLGQVAPGGTAHADVVFSLLCSGLRHADPGQTVTVTLDGSTTPAEGGSVSATDATIGPVPATWGDDTHGISGCPSDGMTLAGNEPSHVAITAPTTPGLDYQFTATFGRSLSPAGSMDAGSVTGTTAVTFTLDVVEPTPADTTAPTFDAQPPDLDLVTTNPAGAIATYATPTATDDADPAPVVACAPASGFLAPIGTTTVTCTATDASTNSATTSFDVRVHLVTTTWDPPIEDGVASVHSGRTLPVKVRAVVDGTRPSGDASLEVATCDGAAERTTPATWDAVAGRWMALIYTRGLPVGCHRVTLLVSGLDLGSFELDVDAGSTGATAHHDAHPSKPAHASARFFWSWPRSRHHGD